MKADEVNFVMVAGATGVSRFKTAIRARSRCTSMSFDQVAGRLFLFDVFRA